MQVGSFTGTVYDTPDDVREQIKACHRPLAGVPRAVAVLGGGVGPENATAQLDAAEVTSGVMLLLGSAAYERGSPEEAVRATVEAVQHYASRPKNALESA